MTRSSHLFIDVFTQASGPAARLPPPLLRMAVVVILVVISFGSSTEWRVVGAGEELQFQYKTMTSCREKTVSVEDFGGVGDGATSNTKAFQSAISNLAQSASCAGGGGQLYVPAGRWLTGGFNLTSCFTLFLHRDAVILASQDMNEWPLIEPLPSYGRGRDEKGPRYRSFIMGSNLTDIIITGDNGTIDGQGQMWWDKFHKDELKYTRGYLIEMLYSNQILISNITLINSPSWNVHPVYSSNVLVSGVTILAPVKSPNTDGINPDSCSQVLIEDCHIVSGDDCVAIKSGWDEYGITVGISSEHIAIKRLTCVSPTSAVLAIGSEMSGGIRDIRAEDITAVNSESGVRIKTAIGRGAFIKDIYVRGFSMTTMKWAFWMTGSYGSHPDSNFDPKAIPIVSGISYSNVVAQNAMMVAKLEGIQGSPFTGICLSNVTVGMGSSSSSEEEKASWACTDVEGIWDAVVPPPCTELQARGLKACPFPKERLAIEDVVLKECSYGSQTYTPKNNEFVVQPSQILMFIVLTLFTYIVVQ